MLILIYPNTKRVTLWRTRHDRHTFIDKCPIVMASGNLSRVVTPLAVFRKEDGSLVLDTIHPYSSYEDVRENTGFPVSPAPFTSPPTEEE
jgi:glutaconate CoA-transferase, subunit B